MDSSLDLVRFHGGFRTSLLPGLSLNFFVNYSSDEQGLE